MLLMKYDSETVTAVPELFKERYADWTTVYEGLVVKRVLFARIHVCKLAVAPVASAPK